MMMGTLLACNPVASDLHVNILYPLGGKGDRTFSDAAYEGLVRASLEVDFTKTEAMPDTNEEAQEIFNSWISKPMAGLELIIIIGETYSFLIDEPDCDFNGRFVVFLDLTLPECDDLKSISYNTYGASFLAGVAAMELSQIKKASVIEGMAIETVQEFTMGFTAGVEYSGGEIIEVAVLSDNESGFNSSVKANEIARQMYEEADVILPVAGASGVGVIEAAKESEGRYAFGVDMDQSYLGKKVIIGSIIKRLDETVYTVITDLSLGKFRQIVSNQGMADEATGFLVNDHFDDLVTDAVEAAYEDALAAEKVHEDEVHDTL